MGQFINAIRISRSNMKMTIGNVRTLLIFLMLFFYIFEMLSDISLFSKSTNKNVTPYAFIFLINDYRVQFVIVACAVVLFCNAPFENESHLYVLFRAGRFSWGFGQILYILKMSVVYICSLVVFSMIPFAGRLSMKNEWGKIWGTIGKTDAGSVFGIKIYISEYIMRDYTPVYALFISMILELLCIICVGLIVYLGNKLSGRSVGTFLGAMVSVLDICISNDWLAWAYRFSPSSLAQLELFNGYAVKWGVNLVYSLRFYLIAIPILGALCIASNYKEKLLNIIERRYLTWKKTRGSL